MITARVIADSISPAGKRITTFELHYPRFVHAEFMTHRMFSRNAASSRAIPAKKMRKTMRDDMAMPIWWGANQKGMQASEELGPFKRMLAKALWVATGYGMLGINWLFEKLGLHKQIANRILEPWFNITVVVTATEWANFYALRNHPAAQPEIKALAEAMLRAHNDSVPQLIQYGEYHLPYVGVIDHLETTPTELLKVSTARCARVSYMNQSGKRSSLEEDLEMFKRLVGNTPKHASPTEHQAFPLEDPKERSGNLVGWAQHRKLLSDENITEYEGLKW